MHDTVRYLPSGGRSRALDAIVPRLPAHHVIRKQLVQHLIASGSRLTLVCAPAGFGKSVLLNECVRQASLTTRIAWFDLLGHQMSPQGLLSRITSALNLPMGGGEPCSELSDVISNYDQPLWIILDDYPRDSCPELDACLGTLMDRSPQHVRWWIGGRRRPAWNLPRLRLQGDLQEVDAKTLVFDDRKLTDLLALRAIEMGEEDKIGLLQQSDGWSAAICLILIEKESHDDSSAAEYPVLNDYVESEVLASLPEELLDTLIILAHIPRFSAGLYAHLFEGQESQQGLKHLRQLQLLSKHADSSGQWFRLWTPLTTVLKQKADRVTVQHAHVLASQWFSAQGDLREAVEHALWAGQPDVAASYLQRYGQDQLLIGSSVPQLLLWHAELPSELFSSTARLIIMHAWALIICMRLDDVEACLANLARFLPQPSPARQQKLIAQYQTIMGVLHRQYGFRSAQQYCQDALVALDESSWAQRMLCHQALAQQATAELDLDRGHRHSKEGLRLARINGNLLFETLLSVDHIHQLSMMGQLENALIQTDQALDLLADSEPRGPVKARLLMLRGTLLAITGEFDAAKATLLDGIKEAEACEDAYLIFGYLGLFQLSLDERQLEHAQQLLSRVESRMRQYQVPEIRYRDAIKIAQGELWLMNGATEIALEAFCDVRKRFESNELLPPSGYYDLQLRARLGEARSNHELGFSVQARIELQQLKWDCLRTGHHTLANQAHLCLAEVLLAEGNQVSADVELSIALNDAEEQQQIQPLLALYMRQPKWIHDACVHLEGTTVWRQRLLQALGKWQAPQALKDSPLSRRETGVLRLIARGHSNQQIADALFISVHTVKTHARRINVKLGVERRTHAVAKAKAEGWIV